LVRHAIVPGFGGKQLSVDLLQLVVNVGHALYSSLSASVDRVVCVHKDDASISYTGVYLI
jgi:hypothetical protein